MTGLTDYINLAYVAATWLLTSAGLRKIFEKCGLMGAYAFIPGYRYRELGKCGRKETEGRICMVMEVVAIVLNGVGKAIDGQTREGLLLELAALVLLIIMFILMIRIAIGLCRTFGVSRLWVFPWILVPELPALVWGYRGKYQPVNLNREDEDEILAGTTPAELAIPAGAGDIGAGAAREGSGLYIRLRERTVWDFLRKRYLLKDICLTIPNGSLVLLLGGSGSGKTTFVNAITGYEKADADMILNGQDIYAEYEKMKYRIGFVPQQDLLRMNDTVIKTLKDAAELRLPSKMAEEKKRQKMENVMDTLGLTAGCHGLVSKKSGGQKKRISIGMELVSDPELFILDEPDSGLDGVIARELFQRLREVADSGRIVIAITHTPDRVVDMFDKVIVLARDSGRVGRLAFYGTPDEARTFFGKQTMEEIVRSVNRTSEGGEGRADEFVSRFALERTDSVTMKEAGKEGSADEQQTAV